MPYGKILGMSNPTAKPKHRRPRGSGSRSQRPDGLWVARDYVGEGSARKRLAAYGRTADEAQRKLDAKKNAAERGRPQTPAGMTVARQLEGWLESLPAETRPATRDLYRYAADLAASELGKIGVRALTATDVERMDSRLAARGLAPQTRSKVQMALGLALKRAERDWAIPNAARLARPVSIPKPQPVVLSEAGISRLLGSLDGWKQRAAILAVSTGVRESELLGLRERDVDFEAIPPVLTVTHQLQRVSGEYILAPPKSDSSRRQIPLTPDAVEAIRGEIASRDAARAAAGRTWAHPIPDGEDLIFVVAERGRARAGSPRSGQSLVHLFQSALAQAGLPAQTWHSLRAVFANRHTIPVEVVSALLGHSSVSVTLRSYARVSEGRKAQAMADLPRLDLTRRLEGTPGNGGAGT